MFENIGMVEILILVVAGLFILGPERLPDAARWVGNAVRQVKEFATGAQNTLKKELGPEFDQIQKPLNELRSLRSLNPRTAITRSLFADDEPVKPNGHSPRASTNGSNGARSNGSAGSTTNGTGATASGPAPATPRPLASDERPPVDPDAT
ncbi:Sec-independent protein translocase protein TatB [Pseudonocardia nematodicida]|uniref:Sec-independent protein translocase protein TatB n=1 Tax=Pseudonocardia nematodicida TaxID=1206997 RepID=A0ABV1KAP7_9PSEU